MTAPDLFTIGCLIAGVLLMALTLGSSFLERLPASPAMIYLALGIAIGPLGWGLVRVDAFKDTALLERVTEVAVLLSLFNCGMKLELPLRHARWRIPVQLATVSMLVTVAAITAVGVYALKLPLGAAVLLGAILAPTDPVLASDVQVADPGDRDRVRFGLTGEGGLNDGTAFPLVMLGLGLLGLHELNFDGSSGLWRWWAVDVLWATAGGLLLGYGLGTGVGRLIIYLRMRHREALDSDEFIALGLIALTYGLALLVGTYGFLAVFAAGLALRRANDASRPLPEPASTNDIGLKPHQVRASGEHAPEHMMRAVSRFNHPLERFAEIGIVLAVGALLATIDFRQEVLWFIPLLFVVIRPVAVQIGLMTTSLTRGQRRLVSWFGIRGIGSLYYLLYAISHGIKPALAQHLLAITLPVVVASVVLHGISVTPMMRRYETKKSRIANQADSADEANQATP
jgi:NhaP-type Na+/H+ or K+/H+ antiporter